MTQNPRFDILVAGNGPAGKSAALMLANQGFHVAIAAPLLKDVDRRTTALMAPSIEVLKELDVWSDIEPNAAPLRSMRIIDATNRLIRARPVTFSAAEIDEDAFGWNIPNTELNSALDAKIKSSPNITRFDEAVNTYEVSNTEISAKLEKGRTLTASLVAGADGRNSNAREASGIKMTQWSYPQAAFVTTFDHRMAHENVSSEFHTESGPCVQVPLPGNSSSLVWVVTPSKAAELYAMTDDDLSIAIEHQLHSILGKVKVGAHRKTYPLSGQYPDKFAQSRIALIGEAAHVFPPIGAQGLNLGLRDVSDLTSAVMRNPVDPGAYEVLSAYDSARRPDILSRTGSVDVLNRSLLSNLLPVQLARALATAFIDQAAPLRGLFMREGMRPGSGFKSIGQSLFKRYRQDQP